MKSLFCEIPPEDVGNMMSWATLISNYFLRGIKIIKIKIFTWHFVLHILINCAKNIQNENIFHNWYKMNIYFTPINNGTVCFPVKKIKLIGYLLIDWTMKVIIIPSIQNIIHCCNFITNSMDNWIPK